MGKTHRRQSDDHVGTQLKPVEPKYLKGFDRINVARGLQALHEAETPDPLLRRWKSDQQEKPHPHISKKTTKLCPGDMPSDRITILPSSIIERHCRGCDTTFGCKDCLETHLKSAVNNALDIGRLLNKCCICGHVCKTANGVDSHSRAKHGMSAKKAESRERKKRERISSQPVRSDAAGGRVGHVVPSEMGDSLVVAYNPTLGLIGEQFRRQNGRCPLESKETLARLVLTEHQRPPKKKPTI